MHKLRTRVRSQAEPLRPTRGPVSGGAKLLAGIGAGVLTTGLLLRYRNRIEFPSEAGLQSGR